MISKGSITHKDIRVASGEVKEARRELCTTKEESGGSAHPLPSANCPPLTEQPAAGQCLCCGVYPHSHLRAYSLFMRIRRLSFSTSASSIRGSVILEFYKKC